MSDFEVTVNPADGDRPELSCTLAGQGPTVILAHGLSATRRYVVMGSRLLERAGYRVIAYDARGHGRSEAPVDSQSGYDYALLAEDMLHLLDRFEIEQAAIVGVSMGSHTAVRFALEHPQRVAALAVITPAFDPDGSELSELEDWDQLADGLKAGGIDGFLDVLLSRGIDPRWRDTVLTATRQRLERHSDLSAVADALRYVPRSRPFDERAQLAQISKPTLIVGSRDQADPGHPLSVAQLYNSLIPGSELVVEQEGSSPLAWQGAQLSRQLIGLISRVSF